MCVEWPSSGVVVALADSPALFFYSWVGQSTTVALLIKRSGSLQQQWCFKIALGTPCLAPHNVRGNFTTSLGCILEYYVCLLMYSCVHTCVLCVPHDVGQLHNFILVHTGVLCVHSDVFWCAYWCIMGAFWCILVCILVYYVCKLQQLHSVAETKQAKVSKFRSFAYWFAQITN